MDSTKLAQVVASGLTVMDEWTYGYLGKQVTL